MKKTLVVLTVVLGIILIGIVLRKAHKAVMNFPFDNPISQAAFTAAGLSKLHVAVVKGDDQTVLDLLNKGADPNEPSADGTTPLNSACGFGWIKCTEILLDHGANIEARDIHGNTPLSIAAMTGKPQVVELLLSRGAKIDVINDSGRTPLQAILAFKEMISSHAVGNVGLKASGLAENMNQCAEILRKHGAK